MSEHFVLIVEDDEANAEDLAQIVTSMGYRSQRTDNGAGARELMAQESYCLILLDLEIRQRSDSIKGHVAHGVELLRDMRQRYGGNRGASFWTPVIVISAHANDVDTVVSMMKGNGADDVIRKPIRTVDVVGRIREALKNAGRSLHESCTARAPSAESGCAIVLRISGVPIGRRAIVACGEHRAPLSVAAMKLLLRLALAQHKGTVVHKAELGTRGDDGSRAISRLREQLRPAVGETVVIDNDHHGGYKLKADIAIGECNAEALKAMGDIEINSLSLELSALMARAS